MKLQEVALSVASGNFQYIFSLIQFNSEYSLISAAPGCTGAHITLGYKQVSQVSKLPEQSMAIPFSKMLRPNHQFDMYHDKHFPVALQTHIYYFI